MIASKDADFLQRSLVYGPPPEVIWLRIGSEPTAVVADLLRGCRDVVRRFYDDPDSAFLSG